MANLKTSQESAAVALSGTEKVRAVQSAINVYLVPSQLATYFRGLVNAFSKNQSVAAVNLTSGTTVSVDASLSNNFRLDLAHNATLANPTNLTTGMVLNFRVKNTGTYTLAFGSKYKFAGGAPTISSGSGKYDLISGIYDATDDVIDCGIAQDLS